MAAGGLGPTWCHRPSSALHHHHLHNSAGLHLSIPALCAQEVTHPPSPGSGPVVEDHLKGEKKKQQITVPASTTSLL